MIVTINNPLLDIPVMANLIKRCSRNICFFKSVQDMLNVLKAKGITRSLCLRHFWFPPFHLLSFSLAVSL